MIDIIVGILLIIGVSMNLYALGWVLLIYGLYQIVMRYFGYRLRNFLKEKADKIKNGR